MLRRELLLPAVAGVLLLVAHLLPAPQQGTIGGLPTICPLKTLAALPCPGCGMTRSLVFSAHGEWAQAFQFHPLGPAAYGALWLALIIGVLLPRFKSRPVSPRWIFLLSGAGAASLGIAWLVRLAGVLPYPPNF
jgi:hypothetical protein